MALTRLRFPPLCCKCGGAATGYYEYKLSAYGGLSSREYLKVMIPWCLSCRRWSRLAAVGCPLLGLVGGFAADAFLFFLLWLMSGLMTGPSSFPAFFAALFILALFAMPIVGFEAGRQFARRRAFRARYSHKDRKVTLRFRNVFFAERVIAHVQRVDEEPV
jgi:hypothetical protein